MDEKEYWKTKWDKRKTQKTNNFAKRSYSHIKNKRFKTLLDIGCGDGKDSLYFTTKGFKVTSIDFSESGIRELDKLIAEKNIKNIKTIQKDIRKVNFPENSFDVIYAHLSLHYFDDKSTTQLFNKLSKILKKDGRIFIKCKSVEDALYKQGAKIEKDMYKKNHARHFFSKDYMKEKLKEFKIIRIRRTSSVYNIYKSAFIEAIATK